MTQNALRQPKTRPFLAMSCVGSFLAPLAVSPATAQPATTEPTTLGGVTVSDTAITAEPGKRQESPKATRPVLDTPQTITIISGDVIRQQNLLTLRDILQTVPGITFGAGEGGGGYGDSINLRGYSANNDITTDGVRDSAQYTRTDPFNLEQIEVTNGANSVSSGSGSVGGTINLVSKRPLARDQAIVAGGIGTDEYYRGTVDINQRLGDLVAVRLNAMGHRNDVPGRDVESYKRWGVAPAVTVGIDSPTKLTLQYLHQEDTNIPQYGVPYYKTATNHGEVPGVDRSDYFGYRNVDTQKTNVDQLTAVFEHEFSDKFSIRNLTRWQDVTQHAIVDPPQGTYCVAATNLTPTGTSCTTTATATVPSVTTPAGYYRPSGPRGTTRNTRNQTGYNQTDLRGVFDTFGIEHTATLGFAATWEKFDLSSGNSLRNPDGTAGFASLPLISISNPDAVVPGPAGYVYGSNIYTGAVNYSETARQQGETNNYAVYFFDTMKLSDHFELNGSLRYERNEGSFRGDTVSATATATVPKGTVTRGVEVDNDDNLFSYRVGAVYKPSAAVSVYFAYGNSKTPSKSSVNGSCTLAGVNGATVSTCNVKPESAKNYEIGAKAEVLEGVLLTIAAFRNERDQFKVISADPIVPDQQLDGASRVNGIALGATGNITPAWTITANYTYLDSKVLRSVADNGPGGINPVDLQRGNALTNTPKHSGSLFTTYAFPFGLQVGYSVTYQGKSYLNNSNSATAAPTLLLKTDEFVIHGAFLNYTITRALSAQLNVKNVTDKNYYTRIRNNGWANPGDARAAVLTLTYKL